MALNTSTIRPGLLVGLKTSIVGNVSYTKTEIEGEHDDNGALVSKWETERRIADAIEHEAAGKVRSKARSLISSVCAQSAFGLLCPENKAGELEQALAAAQELTEEFNSTAKLTSISLYVITGRIAANDVEAVRALNSEARDLMTAMEKGITKLDAKAVRDAANRARNIGQMLTPEAQGRLQSAIDTARATARQIVKAGETAAQEIDTQAIEAIARQRHAFLDLDAGQEIATPTEEGRAVDFEPSIIPPVSTAEARAAQIELE